MFFREEEGEKREAELRREVEERDKQHRENVERLQIQVRGTLSMCVCVDLRYFTERFFVVIVSHCLSQLAQQDRKDAASERKKHSVDSGKRLYKRF